MNRSLKALILGVLVFCGARPGLADIQYFYDQIGRLVQVVDHTGESAQYIYL